MALQQNITPISDFPHYDRHSETRWWEQLPDSFASYKEEFPLGTWESLKIQGISVSDYIFRTYASMAVMLTNVREITRLFSREYRHKWTYYKDINFFENPETFFQPPAAHEIRREKVNFHPFPGAVVEDLVFDSSFEPVNPSMRGQLAFAGKLPPTRARLIRHGDRPRPTLICLHGFVLDSYNINSLVFDLRRFHKLGLDVMLYTMPFHGPRRNASSRFSGDGFFNLDIASINEAMAYSIHDLRVYLDFLQASGVSNIGLSGVSLGAYNASLMASIEPRIDYVISQIPIITIIDLILEWEPVASLIRQMIRVTGVDLQDLRHSMAVHSPLTHKPLLPPEKLFIIAGMGDRMATPKHARLLWEHWGRPDIHWFPGNHIIHLERRKFLAQKEAFLRRIGVI